MQKNLKLIMKNKINILLNLVAAESLWLNDDVEKLCKVGCKK